MGGAGHRLGIGFAPARAGGKLRTSGWRNRLSRPDANLHAVKFFDKSLGLFLATALAVVAAAPDWPRMSPGDFNQRPELSARIDFARYDRGLMAAAIFHETNRARQQLGVRSLRHLPQLDEAADSQASIGALLLEVSHHNPLPSLADVSDRVRAAGLRPELVAENIALTPTLDYDPENTDLGTRGSGIARRFIDLKSGRELEALTYAGFASKVVGQWLNSPGHRVNLLNLPGLQRALAEGPQRRGSAVFGPGVLQSARRHGPVSRHPQGELGSGPRLR